MFRALIDERDPWSANLFPNFAVSHWKLDKTEDAWRRRQKFRRNYHFDVKLCHSLSTSSSNEAILSMNESRSGVGGHIPEQMKRFLLKGVHGITDEGSSEPCTNDSDLSMQEASVHVVRGNSLDSLHSEVKDGHDQKDTIQERKDPYSSSPETENNEVLLSVPCVLVTPKRKLAGHLAVLKNVLDFFGECLVEGSGGSSVFKKFVALRATDTTDFELGGDPKHNFLKLISNVNLDSDKRVVADKIDTVYDHLLQKKIKNIKRHRRWDVSKIKAVHCTRYLLRHTALEIFFNNSVAPIFLNFSSAKDAKDVGTLIVATRNECLFPNSVFPWVLADYSSDSLDFNKSSTFRDLYKPVGALDLKRFEFFEDRYRNFCDPDIPSFYYGSHYSSMGIVLFYLLRLEAIYLFAP